MTAAPGGAAADRRLQGRVAVVTGGASGIGAAIVRRYVRAGAGVLVVDVNETGGRALAESLEGVRFLAGDVGDPGTARAMVEAAQEQLGRLDIVVHNAFATLPGRVAVLSEEAWSRTLRVTLDAVFFGTRAALAVFSAQSSGSIINIASISGLAGDEGLAAYNAAKAAVINLTRTTALESARSGIRVNAICPGLIDTPALQGVWRALPERRELTAQAVPMGRFGSADEVAGVALFLASDDAAYVTGATLVVDGGLTAATGIPVLLPA